MLIQIPLDIPNVETEKLDTFSKKGFVLTVIRTLKGTSCKRCGKPIDKFYSYSKEITLRHLPILDKAVWLKIKPKLIAIPHRRTKDFVVIVSVIMGRVKNTYWRYYLIEKNTFQYHKSDYPVGLRDM
jgi:hypothetical protein